MSDAWAIKVMPSREGGRVQVFGPPDPPRSLQSDERLCTDPDKDQFVVFHCSIATAGQYSRCDDCGFTDSEVKA